MNAIDTNVFVYRLDRSDPRKQAVARSLIRNLAIQGDTILLWQVAGEFARQLSAWRNQGRLSPEQVMRLSRAVPRLFPLVLPTENSLDRALDYAQRYSLSHWDRMLLASCAEVGATTLYTEDMGASRKIDIIDLVNPF